MDVLMVKQRISKILGTGFNSLVHHHFYYIRKKAVIRLRVVHKGNIMKYLIIMGCLITSLAYAEDYPKESYSKLYNNENGRFWSSNYIEKSYYIIYDRQTHCKYLVKGIGNYAIMSPLIQSDGRADCSDINVKLE